MKLIRRLAAAGLRACLHPLGHTLAPLRRRAEYIDSFETLAAARERGQTVSDYVETLWGEQGISDRVVDELETSGCLIPCHRVCEIGPGTGRFLERVASRVTPAVYDIYELDDGWAEWLAATYPVIRRPTDGSSLAGTPDGACGLVQAHNVFVYLKLLCCFDYFAEMARVCAPGGYVVFDYYPDDSLTLEVIESWLAHPERYQVGLPRPAVDQFFTSRGFQRVHGFRNRCYRGESEYVVYRKAL